MEGLREINHQLSSGVAQELIHYCNYLGQGGFLESLVFHRRVFKYLIACELDRLLFWSSEGDLDSLLENATLENSELSSSSASQDSAEERSAKSSHSPKDSQAESSKDSPGRNDATSSSKDTCQGRRHVHDLRCVKTVLELGFRNTTYFPV